MEKPNNFQYNQSVVEIAISTQWYVGLIVTGIPLIFMLIMIFINPTIKDDEGFSLFIGFITISGSVILSISLLRRKIIKRFSVDSSVRSLIVEELWSGLRISRKIYPFETIKRFEVVFRLMNQGSYSTQQVEVAALVFQSGKMTYFTGFRDRDRVTEIAMQLNDLLQEQAGFPPELVAAPLTPYIPARAKKAIKRWTIFFLVCVFSLPVIVFLILWLTDSL
ncbi:MAG: hypothetical protein ACTSWW_00015 [Promethearchaeota archaeon]